MISPSYGLALDAKITSVAALAESYGRWKGIRSNHVVTASGEFTGPDKSSRSISTPEDRELLIALRRRADLVVVDAKTARNEGYKSTSSGPALAIFSATGNFSGIPAAEDSRHLCYLFSPQLPVGFQDHHHEFILNLENPLSGLASWATNRGLDALLLEAGPTLTRTAFTNGLVSESALTISAENLDFETVSHGHPFDQVAKLLSVANSKGASFTYWHH
jgi:riboflavin biosynthesis pyrimidine reductase